MMTGNITQCLFQGFCACLVYQFENNANVCNGPIPTYQQFATRTDYATAVKTYAENSTAPLHVPDGCQPTLFYNFQRHTIRFPSYEDFDHSSKNLPKLQKLLEINKKKSEMCKRDIEAILKWKQPFKVEFAYQVSDAGRIAVRQQVRRLRQRFASVFNNREPFEDMIVDFSNRGNRTRDTAEPFLREWFGDTVYERTIDKRLVTVNPLNRFHNLCEKIMEDNHIVISSPATERLKQSEAYKKLESVLSKRLGFKVEDKAITTIMEQCQFEILNVGSSPWCAVLTEEELRLLELAMDVEFYDTDGYGTYMNENMACPVAVDMLNHIRNQSEVNVNNPKVVLHFSHSEDFMKLAPLFGIGRAYRSDCDDRSWRSSRISPFNTNLNVVYYKCPAQKDRVAVLLNEKMEKLDFCKETLCTAQEFTKYLESKGNGCDLRKICSKVSCHQ